MTFDLDLCPYNNRYSVSYTIRTGPLLEKLWWLTSDLFVTTSHAEHLLRTNFFDKGLPVFWIPTVVSTVIWRKLTIRQLSLELQTAWVIDRNVANQQYSSQSYEIIFNRGTAVKRHILQSPPTSTDPKQTGQDPQIFVLQTEVSVYF